MIDRLTAETQARVTYIVLGIYLALKLLEGFQLITPVSAEAKELVLLTLTFWFLRQRNQEKSNDPTIR